MRNHRVAWLVLSMALGAIVGCRGRSEPVASTTTIPESPVPRPSSSAEPGRPRVVALGDSLTAGLGLLSEQAYPALLQRRLDEEGYALEVVNAGVSGDTSSGGLSRLEWTLEGDVRVLILALGANDGLRGVPVAEMKKNLATIIERARERRIAVLLAGMEAPPNFGVDYTMQFRKTYQDLAVQYKVAFVPFLLQGVAGVPDLNQGDGIHPSAEGARMVADLLWPALKPLVDATTTHQS
jgi:acyl-CoA thioesterase I